MLIEQDEDAVDPDLMQSLVALDLTRIERAASGDKWPQSLMIKISSPSVMVDTLRIESPAVVLTYSQGQLNLSELTLLATLDQKRQLAML